mgnify:CR=1 FL=1
MNIDGIDNIRVSKQGRHFPEEKQQRQAHRPRAGGLKPKIQVQTPKYKYT